MTVEQYVEEINTIKYFSQHEPALAEWRVFTAPTLAAARDAACATARAAARAAAWSAAWSAACAAARAAAWAAARAAAWSAARAAARDAAWDASLDCCLQCVCADLQLDDTHRAHAKARMDVWRRGWALLCDVHGVLYVYGVTPPGGTQ